MWTFGSKTDPGTWRTVDSPTSRTLRDVTGTTNGAVAVGDGGVVVGRGREQWGVLVERGPSAKGRSLRSVAATDDGERVWFSGAGGALGYLDVASGERRNHSKPRGIGTTFPGLAVHGERGQEKLLVAGTSGRVLSGAIERGRLDWEPATRPGGDAVVRALCADAAGVGYGVDGSANVYRTTPEGWERVGVRGMGGSLHAAAADERVVVAGDNGRVYEYDGEGWTPTTVGGVAVRGLAVGAGTALAVGDGGAIHVRGAGNDWTAAEWDGSATLRGAHLGAWVAVGASGTIVERTSETSEGSDDGEKTESGGTDGSGAGGGRD